MVFSLKDHLVFRATQFYSSARNTSHPYITCRRREALADTYTTPQSQCIGTLTTLSLPPPSFFLATTHEHIYVHHLQASTLTLSHITQCS